MTIIGYIRVSIEQQDLDKQRHLLLDYAQQQQIKDFNEIRISSKNHNENGALPNYWTGFNPVICS